MFDHITEPHLAYNYIIVSYFFVGGLGAGAYVFSVAAKYWFKDFKQISKIPSLAAPVALAIGMLLLLLDLGQPFRAWRLFVSFNPHSPVSWGFWILNIFFLASIVNAWGSIRNEDDKIKKIAHVGVGFALATATYTGLILANAPGRALWHSSIVPVMFMNGGLISGLAITILLSHNKRHETLIGKLGKFVAALLIFEVSMIFIEMIVLIKGGTETGPAAFALLSGQYSYLFWALEILLGGLLPIFILLNGKIGRTARAVASILILIGIYTMRHIIVISEQVIR